MAFTMVRPEEAVLREWIAPDGGQRQSFVYFGKYSGRDNCCQAFTVILQNHVLGAHFHRVDQYQVLMGGVPGGTYQHHELRDMMLHYADAYATYGPIAGEDEAMHFFTLRPEPGNFIGYMPKDRDELAWRGRRNRHVEMDHLGGGDFPPAMTSRKDQIWERDEDGAEAFAIVAGPSAVVEIPDTKGTRGQYVFVADGSLEYDGKTCGFESIAWLDADEEAMQLQAGENGARLFVLRFPFPSTSEQHAQMEQVEVSA